MTPARGRWTAALLVAGLLAAAGFAFVADRQKAPAHKPELMLLTSLPIVFGDEFGLDKGGSPALKELEEHYRVRPVSVTDTKTLSQGTLLLMAHPLAQPPEMLVALDQWVRNGGRVLLLADPLLEWPSKRPLGDTLRPPPAFADTGLLTHWGLRLDAPGAPGPQALTLAGKEVLTASPGRLFGTCAISADRLVARCKVGKGQATVIADADFLNIDDLDGPTSDNLNGLVAELEALGQD